MEALVGQMMPKKGQKHIERYEDQCCIRQRQMDVGDNERIEGNVSVVQHTCLLEREEVVRGFCRDAVRRRRREDEDDYDEGSG